MKKRKIEGAWARAAMGAVALLMLSACAPQIIRGGGGEEGVVGGGFGCNFKTCVPVVVPPKLVEVGGLKRVALVSAGSSFRGGADPLVVQLEAELSKVRVNDAPYYQLVQANDRSRQATFEFTSTASASPVARVTEERTRCNDKKCKSSSTYKVSCQVRNATAGATVRVRNASGALLATRQESGSGSSKACQGEDGALASEQEVISSAISDLANKIHDTVAVRSHRVPVRYMDDAAAISDAGRRKRFEEMVPFIKAGRLDRACPVFEELAEIEKRSPSVFYNVGFCAQAQGDWRRAHNLYRQADGLTTSPNKEIAAAIEETRLAASGGGRIN